MKILIFNGSLGVKCTLELLVNSAKKESVHKIICLGDLIGIGKENIECLEIARENEIQLIGGMFEAIVSSQIDTSEIDESIKNKMEILRDNISKEDYLWLSDLKRLTILENLLFMYGNYIDRYALFSRENEYSETDLITRKKHPLLNGIIIGSSNHQNFYNGKRLIQIRTKREYSYSEITAAKFIASPGRLFTVLRGGTIKSSWIIIDTEKKIINFKNEKIDDNNNIANYYYDLENVFSH